MRPLVQAVSVARPLGSTWFFPDQRGAYPHHLEPATHSPGKGNTQKIECWHFT